MTVSLEELGGWPAVLSTLTAGDDLTSTQAAAAMAEILEGAASPALISAFIVALRMKGESVDEMTGLLRAMLSYAEPVPVDPALHGRLVDTCGTGGDRAHTINVSTIAALVCAGAGAVVCKHGNRAATSASGSADLLEALGVAIDLGPDGVARCIDEAGIGFCFAPRFHGAMRHAGPTRRELGCYQYDLLLNPADPRDFCFVERWESDKALDEHGESAHLKDAIAQFEGLVEAPPDIRRYRLL